MFAAIRIIIGIILFLAALLFWKAKGIPFTRGKCVLLFLADGILITLLSFLPVENLWITFPSAESAYQYWSGESGTNCSVIAGTKSDLVIHQKEEEMSLAIVPKNDSGWKLGIGTDTKQVGHRFTEKALVTVYRYKNTEDYYVCVACSDGGTAEVTDTYHSQFTPLSYWNPALQEAYYTYFAYIPSLDQGYCVTVDGMNIFF